MVKTLIIGDLHFDNKPEGLLEAQVKAVKDLILHAHIKHEFTDIVFLGDLMMHRKPYPRVLLALKEVIDYAYPFGFVTILRGNHDSENKSDDGMTALSLFDNARIVTQTYVDDLNKRVFIPHYEDENKIKAALKEVPKNYTVYGHFGYYGALNSAGDSDFSLTPVDFYNTTVLGHIHTYRREENIILLGTPYTTNFSENRKESFYGIMEDGELTTWATIGGPRHLVVDFDKVEDNIDWINDKSYFTLLRIVVPSLEELEGSMSGLLKQVDVGYLETKYKPIMEDKEDFITDSNINPVTEIDDAIIDSYINNSNTTLGKEILLEGLGIIHENQQSRSK